MSNGTQPENGGGQQGGGGMGGWGGGMGGMFSSGTTGWQIESSSKFGGGGGFSMGFTGPAWLNKLWTSDATYKAEVKRRWAELRSGVWHDKTMDKYLDSMKTYLKNAADRNFKRWPNLGQASGTYDSDPEPMKYCNQGGGQQGGGGMGGWGMGGGGMGMAMGGYNATTWDGEFEHVRKKMKERMAWMDEQLGFTQPANPTVTDPLIAEIHNPDWEHDKSKDDDDDNDSVPEKPQFAGDYSRLAPGNFYAVNGDRIEVQTTLGGAFALIDLNGTVLFKTHIKTGHTSLKIPAKARDKHWIVTLNGKMMNK
jgi:hypothetical protein